MTMKACVLTGVKQLEIHDRPIPELEPGHALVRLAAASVCGTDVHQYSGTIPTSFPRIPGHDFAGVVEQTHASDQRPQPGTKVVGKPSFPCKQCDACAAAAYEYCENKRLVGLWSDGCMAEFLAVPTANLVPIPESVPVESACNLEPFAVALNTMRKIHPGIGEWVVVLGCGPIGLAQVKMSRVSGARVIAVDIRDEALEMARDFGAEATVNPSRTDAVARVMELTEGGAEIAIEAAGARATVELLPKLVRKYGKLVNVGIQNTMGGLDPAPIVMKSLTVFGVGGNGGKGQYETCLRLTERGVLRPDLFVTHRMALTDAEKAFALVNSGREGVIKVVLVP